MRRTEIIDAYLEGVEVIERIASGVPEEKWDYPTPCTEWTALDLVGHVLCVAEDYNSFLDGIIGARTTPLLLADDLEQHNSARLAELPLCAPWVRLAAFGIKSRQFVRRVRSLWDTVVLYSKGMPWTVGRHAGFCALEWHIHAWDLACSMDMAYRPACLDLLTELWQDSLPHLPLGGDDKWAALLLASGRQPDTALWRDAS